ncbi:SH3-like domain-containing protein [Kaistia dalseonensis]|uniref:SH3-like domain-containing protein n=1 Tax=Kaistia dalseonensis TaxID=410840 RepID=A0ABU0H8S1_9HYPH|nr:SH3-like domain-containing protein [Kaistia dalseonensis]
MKARKGAALSRRQIGKCLGLAAATLLATAHGGAQAQAQGAAGAATKLGPSGLPLPRFVSLKAGRVNVRVGPGQDYRVSWVFTRSGLPVEVVQEFDTWRRIRDSDGTEGWVFHSLLVSKRTAVVAPWETGDPLPIRAEPNDAAEITAYLQPKVVGTVTACENGWCRLVDSRFRGWIRQDRLWGVYPDETID